MRGTAKLLERSALGAELDQAEAATLGEVMKLRELADGEFLLEEGVADDALHVLVAGKIEVVKGVSGGEFASLAILREGDLAGELSFVDGTVHTVGLRALCDSRVLTLLRSDFENLIDENPVLVYKVMRAIVRSAHKIVRRMNQDFVELSNYIFKQHGRY